ncbi:MAG: T9SS C-terminal target domain-containing protein, partial [Limisphaerales bacterium]
MKLTPLKSMLLGALLGVGIIAPASAGTNFLSGPLPVGTNTWYRTNEYWLQGAVYALSNTVLRIEAGTVIKGTNTGTFGTNVSALYICQGAKIFAEGTKDNPIIFTTWQDDVSDPDDLGIWDRGLWGGLVVLGRTTINGALDVAGNAATPKYEVYEGLEDIAVGAENQRVFRYGGTDDNDDSGVIRYVSIRHGGAKLATDKEINGLSLGAVGRGTTIEFVEVYAIADDGFEFFGGTVNTRYLVSAFCDDDLFDTDMGYRGTNQFWFGIAAPDARNYGMELNNQINEIATTNLLTPQADFSVYNMTLMGAGVTATSTTGGRNAGVILRPYVAPKIYNAIFTDFNERGIELDTRNGVNAAVSVTNGLAVFENTLWWDFVVGSATTVVNNTATNLGRFTVATNYWTNPALTNLIANPLLAGISRTNNGGLDPRPLPGSPALNPANIRATPKDGFLTPVNYIGAFAPNDLWIEGWTALSEYGILATPFANKQTNFLSGPLPVGTNIWYRTNEYWLQGAVYALSNTVLRIEPGTVIKGTNIGTFGTNVSALYICQGAKIYAEGTPWSPIIFTTWQDDVSDPDDLGIWDRGLWGGLV